jgi:hypothetical protein
MRIETNLAGPGSLPDHDGPLLAAVDVEWTKNYQVRNANVPFCYSVVYLPLPADQAILADGQPVPAWFTAVYVDTPEETGELVELAGRDLAAALERAGWLTGHQLSSDLAVLVTAARGRPPDAITIARAAWHARPRTPALPVELHQGRCQVLDTRYDAGHLLSTTSRRLVDVCTDLRLDVTQPELRGSMTAMHRQWLTTRTLETQERIAVLNLRHSLSTALVALQALGCTGWPAPFNVNRLLGPLLACHYPVWLTHPTFVALTAEKGGQDVDQKRHRRR